jgi:hypothetical protein
MKKNLGVTDRIIRFVFMDLLLGMCLWGMNVPILVATVSFVLSLYLIATIVVGYDPLYHIVDFDTREVSSEK